MVASVFSEKSSRHAKPPLSLLDLEVKEPVTKAAASPTKKTRMNADT